MFHINDKTRLIFKITYLDLDEFIITKNKKIILVGKCQIAKQKKIQKIKLLFISYLWYLKRHSCIKNCLNSKPTICTIKKVIWGQCLLQKNKLKKLLYEIIFII